MDVLLREMLEATTFQRPRVLIFALRNFMSLLVSFWDLESWLPVE